MNEQQAIIRILNQINRNLIHVFYMLALILVALLPLIIAALLLSMATGCANYTYNGIRGEDLQHPTLEMAAGIGTAFVVHASGHFVAMAVMGHELHFEGLSEVTDDELTDSEAAWFGRAGFLTANGVGWAAKALGAKGRFWRGYNAGVAFETATYPMWDNVRGEGDDLKMIDRHGYGSLEWGLWSASSIFLNLDNKKK
jgi:hypothetical protein